MDHEEKCYKKVWLFHNGSIFLRMSVPDGSLEFFFLVDHDMHSCISLTVFSSACSLSTNYFYPGNDTIMLLLAAPVEDRFQNTIKYTLVKVPKILCGHFQYSNIKFLLIRINFWNDALERYFIDAVEKCLSFCRTSKPKKTRKASASSLSRCFNEVVCMDYVC